MKLRTNEKKSFILIENTYKKVSSDISLSAKLEGLYFLKKSEEIVNIKTNNQLNSIHISIQRINHKFMEKSKKNEKIKNEIMQTMNCYEENLKEFCNYYDKKLQDLILEKVKFESKLLKATLEEVLTKIQSKDDGMENRKYRIKLEKEIKSLNKKIKNMKEKKENEVYYAMETKNKSLTKQIRKPRTIKKITKFFANRFNSYKVIMKNVINPINERIEEFKLQKPNEEIEIFDINLFIDKIEKTKNNVLNDFEVKLILRKLKK